ncbi:Glycoside hydrolase/deacetylase beta/alpha-barrel [Penicillium angulare]|uniref:Glycoside hydrolase/deacetylase beta/alpha-barrel n=1 Tax=Penicillium angulare TaxID=116970 RepID=UPI0025425480|nr:Glycoside hydrolase/deacetylase beta/alpha-barrel [Penicillium angulare]KAJ5272763.1 Glycoside hydrolase/deacetylase beta/alpha-barrel [Penicillium angulare]
MHFKNLLVGVFISIASLSSAFVITDNLAQFPSLHAADITKRQQSPIPYGIIITHCNSPGVVALTFDDGPYIYTGQMLDTLSQHGARVTFFLNGVNKGNIEAFPELVQRAVNEGHQLGSHTWNHPSLDTLSYAEIVAQMINLEDAFLRILGFYPTYMRAPFLMVTADVLAAMSALKYHVISASIDTKDYENDHPDDSWRSFEKFRAELDAGGTIVLAHDTHQTTVEILVDNMIAEIESRGYEMVTIGECLGDPPEYWYRSSR